MRRSISNLIVVLLLGTLSACSQQKPSDREIARQRDLSLADVKRTELQQVEGRFKGTLLGTGGYEQAVFLNLQVKDVPGETSPDSPDPVLTPKLIGYLRFLYGDENLGEYSDAIIKSAEYYPAQKKLNVVVTHSQFQDLIFNLEVGESQLSGDWTAGSVGVSGSAQFSKEGGK